MAEVELFELLRLCSWLRVDEFQFVARDKPQGGSGFGTHADPVEAGRGRQRAVRFDGDFKAVLVQCFDQRWIQLQNRFAAGAHDKRFRIAQTRGGRSPLARNGIGQVAGAGEFSAVRSIRADKIGVTELAHGRRAVGLVTRPEVAAGEPAKDGGPSALRSFPLECIDDFLDLIRHLAFIRYPLK